MNPLLGAFTRAGRGRRAAERAKARASERGGRFRAHHYIFERFAAFEGEAPADVHVCYIGDRVRAQFVDWPLIRTDTTVWPRLPAYDEEYFEWIDLLEAVDAAGPVFTMLELGAGFGRWSARGALAARQRGKTVRLGLAEAEPKHLEWLKQHLADNNVSPGDYQVHAAAIAGTRGQATFAVGKITNAGEEWFGQAVVDIESAGRPAAGDYYGRPLLDLGGGMTAITVPQAPLSDVLADYGMIDLADFDLQGSEADAIEEAIRPLTRQVRRVHIGTHGKDIEVRLRRVLQAAGWVCLRDYSVGRQNDTAFGRITFVDGVQSWINPRRL